MEQPVPQMTQSDISPIILNLPAVSDEPKYSKSKIAILPGSDDSEQQLGDRFATSLANVAVSSTSTGSDSAIGDIGVIVAGAFLDIQHDDVFVRFSNADSSDSITIELIPSSPANKLMPPLDEETEDMCRRNDLLQYISILDNQIHQIYSNVKDIKHRLLRMSTDFERLRFEIHLRAKPGQILRDERKFHEAFYSQIPEDVQDFFSFTYRVV